MAARESLETVLNVRIYFLTKFKKKIWNIRSVYITRIPEAYCCIETVYLLMDTFYDGIPVWLARFDVERPETADKML
jgi:hypothetical protein